MDSIPTRAELTAALGAVFTFSGQREWSVPATLFDVADGVPMDRHHVCYAALFQLPAGIDLPQDNYRVTAPGGAAWELLATPYRPSPEGLPVMGVVLHYRRPSDAEADAA